MENLYLNSLLFKFPNPESNTPEGCIKAKTEYNSRIFEYFADRNFLVHQNFVDDVEVYVPQPKEVYNGYTFAVFDRYCLKINYNHIHQSPELIVSYERSMRVLKMSLYQFSQLSTKGILPMSLVNRVMEAKYIDKENNKKSLRLYKLSKLQSQATDATNPKPIDNNSLYPVINHQLHTYFGLPINNDAYSRTKNKYKRFIQKIEFFVKNYLWQPDFLEILPLAQTYTVVQPNAMPESAMQLLFRNEYHNHIPQQGLNQGTYFPISASNIILFFIYPKGSDKDNLNALYKALKSGYGNAPRFEGLKKFLGIDFQTPKELNIEYNPDDPQAAQHIAQVLEQHPQFKQPEYTFLCCYLSPISKTETDPQKHELYYQVKETLLRRGIVSQCIDTNKMLAQFTQDSRGTDYFKYTLQNMAVAITAKLGGIPWILKAPPQRDLIIGVGAFRQNRKKFIGAALVFNNTGAFNQYAYFEKENITLLTGAIRDKIKEYTNKATSPSRIVIHYYKRMRKKDAEYLHNILLTLKLEIPIIVLTINETESKSEFVFEAPTPAYSEYMPYSGRYVSLGNNIYLMCNNTRYENSRAQTKDFAFPVKIYIQCTDPDALSYGNTIQDLLIQAYQFSRIYWKSVRQQNLPVTILYPKMIAEIMPHFRQSGVSENIPTNRLWFL